MRENEQGQELQGAPLPGLEAGSREGLRVQGVGGLAAAARRVQPGPQALPKPGPNAEASQRTEQRDRDRQARLQQRIDGVRRQPPR